MPALTTESGRSSIPYAPNPDEAKKLVDQAVGLLKAWEPKQNDEAQLTLWIELWIRDAQWGQISMMSGTFEYIRKFSSPNAVGC